MNYGFGQQQKLPLHLYSKDKKNIPAKSNTKKKEKFIQSNSEREGDINLLISRIILTLCTVVIIAIIYVVAHNKQTKERSTAKIDQETSKTIELEKSLELVKNETIASELRKNYVEDSQLTKPPSAPPVYLKQDTGPKVYSWVNSKGHKVFSNKKPH